jgi:hypothetical protein
MLHSTIILEPALLNRCQLAHNSFVNTRDMLESSDCPNKNDQDPTLDTWCQNFGQDCFALDAVPSAGLSSSPSLKISLSPSDVPSCTPKADTNSSQVLVQVWYPVHYLVLYLVQVKIPVQA